MSRAYADGRSQALTAFLDERVSAGYRIESRTATQAIITRRHRYRFLLGRFRTGDDHRLVVSVDSDREITTVVAGPRRW